jgi:hypothetical protein
MKSRAVKFIYQQTELHFLLQNENDVMVNATEMAKLFNKDVRLFTRLKTTEVYIERLIQRKNNVAESVQNDENLAVFNPKRQLNVADVLHYNYENVLFSSKKAGTFMCRQLAIKFAAWLDVDFEIWINETIEDILFSENYMLHRRKLIEIAETKQQIKVLRTKILNKLGDNDTAIELIRHQDLLKRLENEKAKALNSEKKSMQYKMFEDEKT